MADAGGRFSAISAAEVPPIRRGSALVRGGLPRNKFSPPSPRRIPRRKFLFRQKNFLSDSASEAIGSDRTHSDSGGLNRSPPRNCSANYITRESTTGKVRECPPRTFAEFRFRGTIPRLTLPRGLIPPTLNFRGLIPPTLNFRGLIPPTLLFDPRGLRFPGCAAPIYDSL